MAEQAPVRPTPHASVNTTQRSSPVRQLLEPGEDMFPSFTSLITTEARTAHLTKWGIKFDSDIPKDTTDPNFAKEDKFLVDLRITANQAAIGASPKAAIPNLNANMQDKLLKWHGISTARQDSDPFDPKLFSVIYNEPDTTFICSMPRSLTSLFYIAYLHNEFDFTGDGAGNKWKLQADVHVQRLRTGKKSANSMTWCHAIVPSDTTYGPESTFQTLNKAFSACGITIDPKTFTRVASKDGEQGTNKFHLNFEYEQNDVPRDRHGYTDLTSLMNIPMSDAPFCNEFIHTWFKPEYMRIVFGTCNECYKQSTICLCGDKKNSKRKPAGGSSENAKRRIGMRGAASSSSSFQF